jgi:hypothetical protein
MEQGHAEMRKGEAKQSKAKERRRREDRMVSIPDSVLQDRCGCKARFDEPLLIRLHGQLG